MGTYAGAEQPLVDRWVELRLKTFAVELEAIAPGLSQRIYMDMAKEGDQYPFIIFQCQSPPRDIRGVGVSRIFVDTLYVVKAVAQTKTYDDLAPIANVIDRAMTSAEGSAVQDGFVFTSVRDEGFSLVEVEQGTQFRHLGGIFRIQAQG